MKPKDVKILVVDDEEIVRESLSEWFREDGYHVESAADAVQALKLINREQRDIYFLDIKMPGMDGMELHRKIREIDNDAVVIMITAYAAVDTAVKALKEGAFDYVTKPFDPENLSHLVRNAARQSALARENVDLKESLAQCSKPTELIGKSKHIKDLKELIKKVAATSTTVMIRGESGTGKELVAQNIHALSDRRFSPMVSVNCGALSETLLESELFGHEKGAFTGAMYRRKGKLEIADGGTLFLDEIGTIDTKTQVDLLRAIETREFTRLGGNEIIKSDFRIICATNTDLEEQVKQGVFREDLYYRLQVYTIQIKPLRERRDDIKELVEYFIGKYRIKMNKPASSIETAAMNLLLKFPWYGNVRELENAVERAMVVSKGRSLSEDDFLLNHKNSRDDIVGENASLKELEKIHLFNTLNRQNWNITASAKILGIDRVTIYAKMRQFGIKRPQHG